jgi:hypothetical protein
MKMVVTEYMGVEIDTPEDLHESTTIPALRARNPQFLKKHWDYTS